MDAQTQTVELKNGSVEPEAIVKTTMIALKLLLQQGLQGFLQVYDLKQICLGKSEKVANSTIEKLRSLSLLDQNGSPHNSVKNIVLSAVEGDGLDTRLVSPVKEN